MTTKKNFNMIESKVFTVDFDNTCAMEEFPNVGPDVPMAEWALKLIQNDGHKIILWTCRKGKELEDAVKWFEDRNIRLDGINDWDEDHKNGPLAKNFGLPRKVIGDYNIDDRNLGCPTKIYVDVVTDKEYVCVDWEKIIECLDNLQLLS